ncbi:methylamine utilization protein [Roseateles toxinivorans]|nr:methylamine utilization protein [Roseateles toxinivorans]
MRAPAHHPVHWVALFVSAAGLAMAGTPLLAAPLTVQVRNSQGQPLADAVVAVEVRGARRTAAASTVAQMSQKDREFQPMLLVIQTGSAVNFPNFDTVRHHVYSFSPIKTFEIKLYAGTPTAPVVFDKPGVAALGCNIHDRMSAYIVVVDTPLFGRSDAKGQVQLDVPAGEHQLKAWHGGMGPDAAMLSQTVTVAAAGGQATVSLPVK